MDNMLVSKDDDPPKSKKKKSKRSSNKKSKRSNKKSKRSSNKKSKKYKDDMCGRKMRKKDRKLCKELEVSDICAYDVFI